MVVFFEVNIVYALHDAATAERVQGGGEKQVIGEHCFAVPGSADKATFWNVNIIVKKHE